MTKTSTNKRKVYSAPKRRTGPRKTVKPRTQRDRPFSKTRDLFVTQQADGSLRISFDARPAKPNRNRRRRRRRRKAAKNASGQSFQKPAGE